MKIRNNMGAQPWGTPAMTEKGDERVPLRATRMRVEEVDNPRVELALDSIGRQFGEQGRMPDCIKSLRYVQRDGPALMSDTEGLHHGCKSRSSMFKVEWPSPNQN